MNVLIYDDILFVGTLPIELKVYASESGAVAECLLRSLNRLKSFTMAE
jgi:hypothetical protein